VSRIVQAFWLTLDRRRIYQCAIVFGAGMAVGLGVGLYIGSHP
jgi:hypothetical protein